MRATASALLGVALAAACGGPAPPSASSTPPLEQVPEAPTPRPSLWEQVGAGQAVVAGAQNDDGSWGARGEPGLTGLVLLSFTATGETHNSGAHKSAVKAALRFLVREQDERGGFAGRDVGRDVESQLVAALAVIEAYGMTGAPLVAEPARRATGFVLSLQHGDGGFGDGESRASPTVWAAMALKSARMSELHESDDALPAAAAWLRAAEETADTPPGAPGTPTRLSGDALVAGTLLARIYAGERPTRSDDLRAAALALSERATSWATDAGSSRDDDWWLGTRALFQFDEPLWQPWRRRLFDVLAARRPIAVETPVTDARLRRFALETLTLMATQGYRRVFRDENR